jgi:hypothetical protein
MTQAFQDYSVISGAPAKANSFTSEVLIVFTFKYDFDRLPLEYGSICSGTLVNRHTILTAAHCIVESFETADGDNMLIQPNKYYPTYESMFTVYIGVNAFQNSNKLISDPTVAAKLSKVIKVMLFSDKLFFIQKQHDAYFISNHGSVPVLVSVFQSFRLDLLFLLSRDQLNQFLSLLPHPKNHESGQVA